MQSPAFNARSAFARKWTTGAKWALALVLAVTFLSASRCAASDDEVVMTDTGAPLKVVVRRKSAIYEKPDKSAKNKPVEMFRFYYVLKSGEGDQKTKADFFRIGTGTTAKDEEGWIAKDDVVEWPHRQALGLRPLEGRDLADFYKSEEDLKAAYAGDAAAGGTAPAGPAAISKEPKGGGGINLVPILKRFDFQANGDKVEGYQVAYMHSKGGAGGSGGGDSQPVDLAKMTLDVVFVLDTTSSMDPYIEACKEIVSRIAKQIGSSPGTQGAKVRFGLVAFRDVMVESPPPADWYVAKMVCDLEQGADLEKFQNQLKDVKALGGEDIPEDTFAGMKLAIQQSKWNPDAWKHIIVIGDASTHTEMTGPKNQEKLTFADVAAMAQPRGQTAIKQKIVVSSIRIISSSPEDWKGAEEGYKTLAAGADYPGKYIEVDGRKPDEAKEKVVKEMVDMLTKAAGYMNKPGGAAGMAAKDSNVPGLGLLAELMGSAEQGSDANTPQFASGFACEVDKKGNQMFEPFVLVQYGRLELFASALDFFVKALQQSGGPGSRDVKKVVQSLQILATQIDLGEEINPNMTPAKILAMVLGIPVKSDIFDMTFDKLAAMPESDFQSWVTKVKSVENTVRSHLDNKPIWFSLGEGDAPQDKRHAFLRVKDLP